MKSGKQIRIYVRTPRFGTNEKVPQPFSTPSNPSLTGVHFSRIPFAFIGSTGSKHPVKTEVSKGYNLTVPPHGNRLTTHPSISINLRINLSCLIKTHQTRVLLKILDTQQMNRDSLFVTLLVTFTEDTSLISRMRINKMPPLGWFNDHSWPTGRRRNRISRIGRRSRQNTRPHTQKNNQNTNSPKNPSRLFQESHPGLLSHIPPKTRSTENHPFIALRINRPIHRIVVRAILHPLLVVDVLPPIHLLEGNHGILALVKETGIPQIRIIVEIDSTHQSTSSALVAVDPHTLPHLKGRRDISELPGRRKVTPQSSSHPPSRAEVTCPKSGVLKVDVLKGLSFICHAALFAQADPHPPLSTRYGK